MKDHSTMTIIEFLFSIIWKYVIGFIWYKNLLFRTLPHHSLYDSLHILLVMTLISVAFFMIILRHWKNGWTTTACFVLPFGLYTLMSYGVTSGSFIRIVIAISILISLVYSILLLTRKINHKGNDVRKRIYRNRISRCIYSISCIMTVAMLSLMIGIGWKGYFGTVPISSTVEAEGIIRDNKNEDTIEANINTVLKLRPTVWENLNTYERIHTLQIICMIEENYMGLSDPITVQGDNLSPYTLGIYSDAQKLIQINLAHIENDPVEEILSTLLHEIHHCYECRLADAYNSVSPEYRDLRLFRDARYYSQEVNDYINPREDYYEYMSQHLEMDSEKYAELGVQEYYTYIEKWINNNK